MSEVDEEPTTNGFDYDSETASLTEEEEKVLAETVKANVAYVIDKRSQPLELPDTVSVLKCASGSTVYLIGTAHFSQKSIEDVVKVMNQVLPDFVVVELCTSRAHVLLMDEEKIKQGIENLNFFDVIKSNGASNGILQYLLLRLNAYLVKTLGMAPGGEFRAAAQKAAKQTHCHVVLGDRSVGITLQRAFAALGPWTKIKLFFSLLFEFKPVTKEEIEEMKQSDFLEKIIKEMAGDHPELTKILLGERDMYLTRSIWNLTGMANYEPSLKNTENGQIRVTDAHDLHIPFGDRDPNCAVSDAAALLEQLPSCCPYWPSPSVVPRVIVAVVGIGHVAGIKKYWDSAGTINQMKLQHVMDPPLSWKVFKWTIRGLLVSSIAGLGYVVIKGSYYLGYTVYKFLR